LQKNSGFLSQLILTGGKSYKYEISSEATVDETKFAVVQAFEDFKVKEGQSAVRNYKWDVHDPVRKVNKDTGGVEMVIFIVCNNHFFLDKQRKVSNIIQDYLVKDAAAVPKTKTISKSAKKASSCEGCKEIEAEVRFSVCPTTGVYCPTAASQCRAAANQCPTI
jgi:hypothetical protein